MKHKPLLRIVLTVTACLFVFAAFGSMPQITITGKGFANMRMTGSGTVTIDWGDGGNDTYTLYKDSVSCFERSYPTATTHTVTITGNLITGLNCSGNQLTSLDVSGCAALKGLSCDDNQLTSLDVSKNIALTWLICSQNQLTAVALNALFGTLPNNTEENCFDNQLTVVTLNALFNSIKEKGIYIDGNPGISTCDRSIATAKGWTVNTTY